MNAYTKPEMPDVAATQTAQQNGTLDWVGMSKIALPVVVKDNQHGNYDAKAFVVVTGGVGNGDFDAWIVLDRDVAGPRNIAR